MNDDIVTRLRGQMSNEFVIDHPNMVRVPTLYEQAADEIERLQAKCDRLQITLNNLAERNQTQNAEQLRIVRAVEADRDRWKALAIHNDNLAQIQAGIYPPIPHYEEK